MSKFQATPDEDFVVSYSDLSYLGPDKPVLVVNGASGNLSLKGADGSEALGLNFGSGLLSMGNLLIAAGKVLGTGAPQLLSGAGAVLPSALVTLFTSTGAAQALTLADGSVVGQLKVVAMVVDGGSGVLTPAHPSNFSTLTLTNRYDCGIMLWDGLAWQPVLATGAAAFA